MRPTLRLIAMDAFHIVALGIVAWLGDRIVHITVTAHHAT
jgi:hypothetical protein